jgi:hypothetical protein
MSESIAFSTADFFSDSVKIMKKGSIPLNNLRVSKAAYLPRPTNARIGEDIRKKRTVEEANTISSFREPRGKLTWFVIGANHT